MGSTDPTDAELIAAINSGDAGAFETLYFRYRDWAGRLARRFTGDDTDALDVLQETFVYLYRKFPGFELSAKMTTFLWPVIRNLSLQARRRRARSLAIDESALDIAAPSSGSHHADLLVILNNLSAAHRQVVLMRIVDELTLDEIAALLAVPTGTVKSRLHHAFAQLRVDPATRDYFQLSNTE